MDEYGWIVVVFLVIGLGVYLWERARRPLR